MWRLGLRYRKDAKDLPGRPDLVFRGARIAVFCDGDFWHGRNWPQRKAKLARGHNAAYWILKIERNRERDAEVGRRLREIGWTALRFWESDIRKDAASAAARIKRALALTPSQ